MKYLLIAILCLNCSNIDIPQFNSIKEANKWVNENIEYTRRPEITNIFPQCPDKTLKLRTGLCWDYAILFMKILKDQFNIEAELIILDTNHTAQHAIVYYNWNYYDPTAFRMYINIPDNYSFNHSIDYNTAMFLSMFNCL